MNHRSLRLLGRCAIIAAIVFTLAAPAANAWARQGSPGDEAATIALAELPREARETVSAIRRGGPFAYDRDGVVFNNFERALPVRERGFYHEYTVPTPGLRHRGARRVVAARDGALYYSEDHYRTFRRIRE